MLELNLGASLELLVDHRGKTPKKLGGDFVLSGVPVISAQAVVTGRVQWDDLRCVTEEMADKWMPQPMREGDVLLTSEAPLGKVARVDRPGPIVLGQRVFGLRGLGGVLDSGYLFYALQTPLMQSRLAGRSTGTTVLGIRQSALRGASVPAPSWTEQRAIAEVLGALDDKIAANHRMNELVLELAGAQWIDAYREGRAATLSDLLALEYGKALPETARTPGSVVVSGSGGVTGCHDRALVAGPAVVVGRKGTVGATYWVSEDCWPIDTTFYVVPQEKVGLAFCFFLLQHLPLGAMNNDSAVPGLNRNDALALPIRVPEDQVLEEFERGACALFQLRHKQEKESDRLAALRDALLPELMSGRLRVKDAEKTVEEVV